ncbi:MAG TPA: hypothetical protein VFF39_07770, partial [Verrucomicrobiae bacterium]|nr:hypothetical protein [Verrucomicrobiae bacterium]
VMVKLITSKVHVVLEVVAGSSVLVSRSRTCRGMIFLVLLFVLAVLGEGRQTKKQHNCDY